jgi:predicted O-linked N-acetylglucosamine transferase (SPINDLY family)
VALATEPQRLAGLKQRLTESRLTTPLFNARLNMRRLEHAYLAMQARSVQGLPPEHIWVD